MEKTEQQVKDEMLREAVSKGQLERVKALVKLGADVHQKWTESSKFGYNPRKFTLLSLAGRHPEVKEFLLGIINPPVEINPLRLKIEQEIQKVLETG